MTELSTLFSYLKENKTLELTLVDGELWDMDTETDIPSLEKDVETLLSKKELIIISSGEEGKTETSLSLKDNNILIHQQEYIYTGEQDEEGETSETVLSFS